MPGAGHVVSLKNNSKALNNNNIFMNHNLGLGWAWVAFLDM